MRTGDWLAEGKSCAVVLSVDDVHPAPSASAALAHIRQLQQWHPQLRATLFTTPDWRTLDPYPSHARLTRLPIVRNFLFMGKVHPRGTFRLDRHERFCAELRAWTGVEIALHGLEHVRRGARPVLEFDGRSVNAAARMIDRAVRLVSDAKIPLTKGMSPPGWHAPDALLDALADTGFQFLASARDLDTPPAAAAQAAGSGLRGVPLVAPHAVRPRLIHFPTNYQATSTTDRAIGILESGGLLSIKAHLLTECGKHYKALDGLSPAYRDKLHALLTVIEDRFGDRVWWTTMGEIAARLCA